MNLSSFKFAIFVGLVGLPLIFSEKAVAISWIRYKLEVALIRNASSLAKLACIRDDEFDCYWVQILKRIENDEAKKLDKLYYEDYLKQQQGNRLTGSQPYIGQVSASGNYPWASLSKEEAQNGIELTFGFVDPFTGDITAANNIAPVASVLYEVNIDSSTPSLFLPIGSSSDATSNFAINYIIDPSLFKLASEPFIQATPLDSSGNPIVFIDPVDGTGNVAMGGITLFANPCSVPEPSSTLSLLALGTIGAASTLKRKLKPSQSIEKETTKVG